MPDLLEVIAANDTAVLEGWAAAFNDRAPKFDALPIEERRRELLTLAREFTRRAAWATDTAEGWLTELKARLREGMNGDKFRALLHSGRTLCGTSRTVVEIAGDLWRLAGTQSDALPAIEQRLAVVEVEVAAFAKRAELPSAETIEKLFQRAEEQTQKGKGLTREQALAAIRKAE